MTKLFTNLITCLLVCCLFSNIAQAQWITAGGVPASDAVSGGAIWSSMDVSSQGIPYVLYNETGYKVKRLVNGAWEQVGGAITSVTNNNTSNYPYIQLDNNDVPYVAYQDPSNSSKLTVQKFNGTSWELVGTAGFTTGAVRWPFIKFDNNNVPYVAHRDTGANRGRVVRFVNGEWVYLANFHGGNNAEHVSLDFDSNNVPYVGFRDGSTAGANRLTVKKYNEANEAWEVLGTEAFNAGGHATSVSNPFMALDNNDVPHVLFSDGSATAGLNKMVVMRFDGTTWETVGTNADGTSAGFSVGSGSSTTNTNYLFFGLDNRPVAFFADAGQSGRGVFMILNEGKWEMVGGAPATVNGMTHAGAAMYTENSTMYLSYRNTGNGSRVEVRSYAAGPAITASPANKQVTEGEAVTFTGSAEGTSLTYQWQVNRGDGKFMNLTDGGIYSGTRTTTLTIGSADATLTNYKYRMVAIAQYGSSATSNATLVVVPGTICFPPEITTQPAATAEICQNLNASFTVAATGSEVMYQWQVSTDGGTTFTDVANNEVYNGANAATLNISGATPAMNGNIYQVRISGACAPAVTSNRTALTVNQNVAITAQPVATAEICQATNTSFTVGTTGTGVVYQWQVSTDGTTFTNIVNNEMYDGATTATLGITGATPAMSGNLYQVLVSGTCSPAVASNRTALTVNQNAAIAVQPVAAPASCIGSNVNFTVGATGAGATYQWQVNTGAGFTNISNGAQYSGATTNSLTVAGATTAMNSNRYRVVVSGTCAPTVTSSEVQLNVYQPLAAGTVQAGATICYNTMPAPITSLASATGGDNNYTYTWETSVDGTTWQAITGQSGASYTPAAPLTRSTSFRRGVSSATCGGAAIYTAPVMVTVYGELMPGEISGNQTVTRNATPAVLGSLVDATGGTNVTYQWEMSVDLGTTFTPAPALTNPNLRTYQPAAVDRTTIFRRKATSANGCGTVISNTVTVTVSNPTSAASDIAASTGVQVYPNPSASSFNISAPGKFSYTVYNGVGQVMEHGQGIGEGKVGAELRAGLYFIQLQTDGGSQTIRLQKR